MLKYINIKNFVSKLLLIIVIFTYDSTISFSNDEIVDLKIRSINDNLDIKFLIFMCFSNNSLPKYRQKTSLKKI